MRNLQFHRKFLARMFTSDIYKEAQLCITLAIPLSLAQLIEMSMFTVDTWAMGQLGSQTLGGGAIGCVILRFLSSIGIFTISAVNTVAAIAYGSKQFQKLNHIVTQGCYLALLLAVPMMLILGTASIWMVLFKQEETIIILANSYLQAVLWGLPALLIYEVLRNVLAAVNQPNAITAIAIGSIFLNFVCNYLLAFGKFGFPALGLAGIGWATVIVLWFQLLTALGYIYFNPSFKDYQFLKQGLKVDTSIFLEIIQVGWPIGTQYILGGSYQILLLYLLGYFGSISLAAFQIADQVGNLIRNIVFGIAQATVARVAQMYGQQSLDGVRRAGSVGISLSVFVTLVTMVMIMGGYTAIVHIFLTPKDPIDFEVFQLACTFLMIIALHQVINGVDTTATAALRGIKDTTTPMLLSIISCWAVGIGSAYLFSFYWHLQGVGLLISNCLSALLGAAILPLRFHFKTLKLLFRQI